MRLLAFFLAVSSAWAQATITISSINAISDKAARVNVTVSAAAVVYAQFGTTTSYGSRSAAFYGATNAVINITGLPSGALVNYRICQDGFTPPAGCTANNTFSTLYPQDPIPALPTAVNTAYPSSFSATYTVDANCSNLQAHLNTARSQDGNNNYLISIPKGTYCGYRWTLPVKNGPNPNGPGVIVIASDGVLPPAGSRITPDFQGETAIFLQSNILFANGADPSCNNFSLSYRFDQGVHKVCRAPNAWTLVSAEPGYTSGVGAPSPPTCTAGRFYRDTSVGASGLWYCHPPSGRWQQTEAVGDAGYSMITASGARGYRLVGIEWRNLFDNQWMAFGYFIFDNATNVICDRCLISWSNGFNGHGFNFNGSNIGVIDSYIDVLPQAAATFPIAIRSGTGPFIVGDSFIRGCAIPVFGTDDDTAVSMADITISGNDISMNQKCNPRSGSYDGVGARDARSAVELKRGTRLAITDNLIHDWSPAGAPIMGAAILLTPRASGSTGGDNNQFMFSDITIRNNIFYRGTGGIEIWGSDDSGFRNTVPSRRMLVENNLGYDIDGLTYYAVSPTRASFLYVQEGFSDLTVRNNTWIDHRGTGPAIITITAPVGGLSVTRNIFWLNQGDAGGGDNGGGIRFTNATFATLCNGSTAVTGSSAATKLSLCAIPLNVFRENAIIGGVAGYTAAFQPTYPAGNYWPGDTTSGITAMGFRNYAGKDFAFRASSAYAPLGVGADFANLPASPYSLRALSVTSSAATVYWTAPDTTTPCTVEYGTSATPGSGSRVTDTPTSRFRSRSLTGLAPSTLYYTRVYCGQMSSFSFQTQ